jgi:hypothetical protein
MSAAPAEGSRLVGAVVRLTAARGGRGDRPPRDDGLHCAALAVGTVT